MFLLLQKIKPSIIKSLEASPDLLGHGHVEARGVEDVDVRGLWLAGRQPLRPQQLPAGGWAIGLMPFISSLVYSHYI